MRISYACLDCRLKFQLKPPRLHLRRAFTTTSPRRLPDSTNTTTTRPPTGPKPAPKVRHIRENAELYSQNCMERNNPGLAEYPFRIRTLADEARDLQHALTEPRTKIKELEKAIAGSSTGRKGGGEHHDALRVQAKQLKDESDGMMRRREECMEEIHRLALALPNLTSPDTPVGNQPRVVEYINYDPLNPPDYITALASSSSSSSSPSPRSHVSIGADLDLIDFTSSATTSGWGWYYLINEGALLEQALVQYALAVALRRGWKPVSPPSLVYSYMAEACGFQPRDANDEQQIWSVEQSARDRERNRPRRCLAGTAEIPLAAMLADRVVPATDLPIRHVGASRCYRAEAGARGVDTKGLYRVHEFTKVELFGWANDYTPNDSTSTSTGTGSDSSSNATDTATSLFTEMLAIQSEILTALDLPCRVLEMPSTDLGASASRKRDIETLFPSRLYSQTAAADSSSSSSSSDTDTDTDTDTPPALSGSDRSWGEVTSASICTDYQSRRLNTRVDTGSSGGPKYSVGRVPHTVNGTALAVPRIIAALLENGWDDNAGGVVIPEVLRGYMGGLEIIRGKK